MAFSVAVVVEPVVSRTAHHSRALNSKLTTTQMTDHMAASRASTTCEPFLRSSTKSTRSAATTMHANTTQSHSGSDELNNADIQQNL